MVEIKLQDISTNDRSLMLALSDMFKNVADGMYGNLAGPTVGDISVTKPESTIAPEDSPAAGVNPAEVFGRAENPTAAEVFGGNAAGGASVGTPATSAPVAASIPPAPPSAPSAAAATADLDAAGLPWDARIHSSSKEKNKTDGKWRARRGVDAAEVVRVEAELRAVMGNGVPAAPSVDSAPVAVGASSSAAISGPAPSNAGNLPPPPPPPPANGAQAATVAPPPAPATASAVTVTDAPAQISFPQLCGKITAAISNGSLTHARLAEVLAAHKLQGLPTLAAFPHLVGPAANDLGFA